MICFSSADLLILYFDLPFSLADLLILHGPDLLSSDLPDLLSSNSLDMPPFGCSI
jgi:hypothetical protein